MKLRYVCSASRGCTSNQNGNTVTRTQATVRNTIASPTPPARRRRHPEVTFVTHLDDITLVGPRGHIQQTLATPALDTFGYRINVGKFVALQEPNTNPNSARHPRP
eukprot:gene6888-biopygen4196